MIEIICEVLISVSLIGRTLRTYRNMLQNDKKYEDFVATHVATIIGAIASILLYAGAGCFDAIANALGG